MRLALQNDDIWWEYGQRSTFEQFLKTYILHDSHWLGMSFHLTLSSVIAFHWDLMVVDVETTELNVPTYKNNEDDLHYGEWAYLFISFPYIYHIITNQYKGGGAGDYIVTVQSRSVSDDMLLAWIELLQRQGLFSEGQSFQALHDEPQHTIFEGLSHDITHIIHSENVTFLCLDASGKPVVLNNL